MDNKNRFWGGFLAGIISALGVAIIVGVFYLAINVNNGASKQSAKDYSLSNRLVSGNYEKTTLDYDHILTKIEYLQNAMDKYFLFDEDAEKVEDMIYAGMLRGLKDPYTAYYNEKEYKSLQESTSGIYYGIGVQVAQDTDTGIITITRVFSNSPSIEAGLRPEDTLYKVEDLEVTGMDLSTVVTQIKGSEGTTVKVGIYRPSTKEYLDFDIERRDVSVDTTIHNMLTDKIGYIQLMEFDEVSYDQFMEAYNDLKSQGMTAWIIDLRGNPGGLLTSMVNILDEILPKGTIIYTEDKNGKGETYTSDDKKQIDIPMVVLVNKHSASASEAFAGAIKDYQWGTIVGTTTFGKGIAQSMFPIGDGSAIKVTVANYFTPNGNYIHKIGIVPDVEVELDENLKTKAVVEQDEDNQLQKGIEILQEKLNK